MKYSSCITNANLFDIPFEITLEAFIKMGFDAIDIPGDKNNYPIDKIKEIYSSYSEMILIGEITAMMNSTRDLIHPEKKIRDKSIEYVKYCIKVAAEIGVNLTHMCFLSFPGNIEQAKKWHPFAIHAVKECCKYAKDLGVKLMIEPLFQDDISIINRCDQAINILSEANNIEPELIINGETDFGLLQDIFHMHHEEENMINAINNYSKCTYHLHVADHIRSLDFARKDSKFVNKAIEELNKLNYDGFVSFESFHESVTMDSLKDSLNQIKKY